MGKIVERPADRHLNEPRLLARHERLAQFGAVVQARGVRPVIGTHQAAVVKEAVRDEKIDGAVAEVPRGRAVAARLAAGEALDRRIGAHEVGLLLLAALARRWNMRPAVMRDLVAVLYHRRAGLRMTFDGETRNEPGAAHAMRFKQPENALRAGQPELAARQRRRARHAARDEAGLSVEIEGEADDVAGHVLAAGLQRTITYNIAHAQQNDRHHR